MPSTEAQKKASAKYNTANIKQIKFQLNKKYDTDIIDHLNHKQSIAGYLKALIRADMAQNTTKNKEEHPMWYIIDDMNATPISATSEEDAARIMRETWLALTPHDRAERESFFVALCKKGEDGEADLNTATKVHNATDADQVMLAHFNDILREMTAAYRTVLECDGSVQESIYIWSDGSIEVLEGCQGDNSTLVARSHETRKLYYVTTIDEPFVNVFALSGINIPDNEEEIETAKAEAIDWLVETYDDEARAKLNAAIKEAEFDLTLDYTRRF